jgi:hypothetical protein
MLASGLVALLLLGGRRIPIAAALLGYVNVIAVKHSKFPPDPWSGRAPGVADAF